MKKINEKFVFVATFLFFAALAAVIAALYHSHGAWQNFDATRLRTIDADGVKDALYRLDIDEADGKITISGYFHEKNRALYQLAGMPVHDKFDTFVVLKAPNGRFVKLPSQMTHRAETITSNEDFVVEEMSRFPEQEQSAAAKKSEVADGILGFAARIDKNDLERGKIYPIYIFYGGNGKTGDMLIATGRELGE